jgi:hypothetical protein
MLRVRNSIFQWYSTCCISVSDHPEWCSLLKLWRNKKLHREKLALTHFSHAKLREHLNAPWAPVAKPLTSRSRDHGNVEAPCPDQRPQRRELGNIALACCPWNSGIWQTAKTDAPTLLRNSSTQHWIPFQAPPTCGKFVNSLSGKPPMPRRFLIAVTVR